MVLSDNSGKHNLNVISVIITLCLDVSLASFLPELSPQCVSSSRNIPETEKHNRRVCFHERIIIESQLFLGFAISDGDCLICAFSRADCLKV